MQENMKHAFASLCLLQTFLRVRANRHTRLNGTSVHVVLCCRWLSLALTDSSVQKTLSGLQLKMALIFFFFFKKVRSQSFIFNSSFLFCSHWCEQLCGFFTSRSDITLFPTTSSTGLAPTRAEELLTFQLWPLDMLTVDDLCWCRCYVKSAPLRPHSAGAHLDCTQAGKTHPEALCSSTLKDTEQWQQWLCVKGLICYGSWLN